jgi:hypothetical protein
LAIKYEPHTFLIVIIVRQDVKSVAQYVFVFAASIPNSDGAYWHLPIDTVEEQSCFLAIPHKSALKLWHRKAPIL